MIDHVLSRGQEIPDTNTLFRPGAQGRGEAAGKSWPLNFGQCFLSCLPQAAVAENFPQERPSSKAPQGHAAGFRGLHLPRGDGVLLHPVSEEREADSTLGDPGHPHACEKEVAQRHLPPLARPPSAGGKPQPPQCAAPTPSGFGKQARCEGGWGPGVASPSLRVGRPRAGPPPPRLLAPGPWSPALLPTRFAARRLQRPRGRSRIPARGRRRHHVSGPGRRGRRRAVPAPRPERTPAAAPGPIRTRRAGPAARSPGRVRMPPPGRRDGAFLGEKG